MARRRNAKGRFVKARSNPRRKRRVHANPVSHKRRRRGKKRGTVVKYVAARHHKRRRSNPRRHYRARIGAATRSACRQSPSHGNPAGGCDRRRGRTRRKRALGFILPYLPATFTSGYALHGVRILNASLLAYLGKNFGGRVGAIAGRGAVAVAMFQLFRDITVSMAPTLPLGTMRKLR